MRRQRMVLAIVAGALLTVSAVVAAPHPAPVHLFLTPFEMALYLDLTEDQKLATEELRLALAEELGPVHEEQVALREELRELLDADEPDLPAIGAVVVTQDDNRETIGLAHQAYEEDFRALLTAEQLPKLENMQELLHLLRHRNPPPPEEPAS